MHFLSYLTASTVSIGDRLLQRYQNVKNELETQQNKERINREKQITVVLGVGGVSMRRKKKANKADTVKNP